MVDVTREDIELAMRQRTDAELLAIVSEGRQSYRSDALMVADLEFKRRGLEGEALLALKQEAAEDREEARRIATEPLETHWRLVLLIFPYVIALEPYLSLHTYLTTGGYQRKHREFWICVGVGFVLNIGFLILYSAVSTALGV